jgi:hypothetical protein
MRIYRFAGIKRGSAVRPRKYRDLEAVLLARPHGIEEFAVVLGGAHFIQKKFHR